MVLGLRSETSNPLFNVLSSMRKFPIFSYRSFALVNSSTNFYSLVIRTIDTCRLLAGTSCSFSGFGSAEFEFYFVIPFCLFEAPLFKVDRPLIRIFLGALMADAPPLAPFMSSGSLLSK